MFRDIAAHAIRCANQIEKCLNLGRGEGHALLNFVSEEAGHAADIR